MSENPYYCNRNEVAKNTGKAIPGKAGSRRCTNCFKDHLTRGRNVRWYTCLICENSPRSWPCGFCRRTGTVRDLQGNPTQCLACRQYGYLTTVECTAVPGTCNNSSYTREQNAIQAARQRAEENSNTGDGSRRRAGGSRRHAGGSGRQGEGSRRQTQGDGEQVPEMPTYMMVYQYMQPGKSWEVPDQCDYCEGMTRQICPCCSGCVMVADYTWCDGDGWPHHEQTRKRRVSIDFDDEFEHQRSLLVRDPPY